MVKRLVMCCDGTWNTPDQRTDGVPTPTNVAKVALGLASTDSWGTEQRLYYHRGVGTNRTDRLIGGAFGAGLFRAVRATYRFVIQNYEPGDELFFFGFSRGAFTARSTAGLIRNSGVLRRENIDQFARACALYRDRSSGSHPRGAEATLFRKMYSHEPRIRFIGVWDTVGALGIPMSGLRLVNLFNRRHKFHDTDLSSIVDEAYQALAIDERRGPFVPTIWSQSMPVPEKQVLEQVWFSGAHCDVGGGYLDHGLSDVALWWMLEKARGAGLELRRDAFRLDRSVGAPPAPADLVEDYTRIWPDPSREPHDSRTGLYRVLPAVTRRGGAGVRSNEYLASTVDRRKPPKGWWQGQPPLDDHADLVKKVDLPEVPSRMDRIDLAS
ncbi:DUF2235 domain-containing protein [Mycolicibacterium goodii]|uniref:T6SS Phospholipase effector Tle1-like catalytic domain-containing protein n=1 Tax=Mycolicibacterium goodii TaxID=134601 RepID=A0A0K0X805_MYCGD|nr:hypothetical protein AFA91_18445 [Mycolicibacterium goodii]